MVIMPRDTTMIQARDAMLAADLARFGGANQDLLWQGFAMRGFGQNQNTVSNADTDPVPDFSSPMANNATLNFSADSKDKDAAVPVKAKIYVGDYEARSTPIADTDPATVTDGTNATGNLDNTAQFVPDWAELARSREALVVVQLRRRRARLRIRPIRGDEPSAGPDAQHRDPLRDELRVGGTGRDDHWRRARNEYGSRQADRRHRVDKRRTDRSAGRRSLGRRRPGRLETGA